MSRFHALKISEVRRETPDSVSIRFDIPGALAPAFRFSPGQYLTLSASINGEEIRRAYSICSGPDEAALRIGIKRVAGGAFSTHANENLKVGDILDVMVPEGRFTPRAPASGHALAIAAGSGITPVLSIAKSLLTRDAHSRFTLIYGNRTSQSVMFAEEIEDLKNRYLDRFSVLHILSREAQDVPLLSGRITGTRLRELAAGMVDFSGVDEAFLCGPAEMVTEAADTLRELGIAPAVIRTEVFTPAAPRRNFVALPEGVRADDVTARVSATLDGKRHVFDMHAGDDNIIDAAARAGIELPYSCKGGMCCTCRCKVEAGAVEMAVNYSLEPWETEAGFVLACQSRPKTGELSLDFDQL